MIRQLTCLLVLWLGLVSTCRHGEPSESDPDRSPAITETDPVQDGFDYPTEAAAQLIRSWVDSTTLAIDVPRINEPRVARDLFAFYSGQAFKPAWNPLTAGALLDQIDRLDEEGLNPDAFPHGALRRLIDAVTGQEADAETGARLDVLLSATYLKLADMIATGKVKPGKLSASWHIRPAKPDTLYTHLQQAVTGQVASSLDAFRPRFGQYAKLQKHLKTYRAILDQGGWTPIDAGKPVMPGDSGRRVIAIRNRLHQTGDLDPAPDQWERPAVYDSTLLAAVNRYQTRNGLTVEPAITDRMIAAMNVPVETRLKQIMLNLDRIRWFSTGEMPDRYVLVNIPAYHLHIVAGGQTIRQMKVVVGTAMNATPIFSDVIEYAEFSPYWNVPNSIATNELWPAIRKSRSYLRRHHYEILDGWGPDARVVSRSRVNWNNLDAYRIRQKPGPWNALGLVKFMFPNEFAVYLHDTPADQLFERTHRAFSHGCVRVEDPAWMADWLFPQFDRQTVKEMMTNNRRQVVRLEEKLPVYIFYQTAFEDETGRLNFREDTYGLDKRLTPEFDTLL
ncbi:L,D-transpeptidase [Fibrisoma montanum]|uniref:L,D-transpeptidase n=1 Tax=Fibrisoma montanum TaxID=2305895 RepID=A0A418MAX5_9BACT|nr:L,D-transpeptidase family protein [Fibrisoma montanum]RIV23523.1 L,D-transpeptidase [Fibrisoma montanum]